MDTKKTIGRMESIHYINRKKMRNEANGTHLFTFWIKLMDKKSNCIIIFVLA
jgi:hypothetical protein